MCNIHEKSSYFLSVVIGFSLALTYSLLKDIIIGKDKLAYEKSILLLIKSLQRTIVSGIPLLKSILFALILNVYIISNPFTV